MCRPENAHNLSACADKNKAGQTITVNFLVRNLIDGIRDSTPGAEVNAARAWPRCFSPCTQGVEAPRPSLLTPHPGRPELHPGRRAPARRAAPFLTARVGSPLGGGSGGGGGAALGAHITMSLSRPGKLRGASADDSAPLLCRSASPVTGAVSGSNDPADPNELVLSTL